ncbi:hypothetical protein N431DRAFT_212430 [Stipitochalara longipes BDJ]|nr:hypothetical protein N431DRAFT_212430 [Stipitochalara longipes BDJ]
MPDMAHESALIEKQRGHRASNFQDSNLDKNFARINSLAVLYLQTWLAICLYEAYRSSMGPNESTLQIMTNNRLSKWYISCIFSHGIQHQLAVCPFWDSERIAESLARLHASNVGRVGCTPSDTVQPHQRQLFRPMVIYPHLIRSTRLRIKISFNMNCGTTSRPPKPDLWWGWGLFVDCTLRH